MPLTIEQINRLNSEHGPKLKGSSGVTNRALELIKEVHMISDGETGLHIGALSQLVYGKDDKKSRGAMQSIIGRLLNAKKVIRKKDKTIGLM